MIPPPGQRDDRQLRQEDELQALRDELQAAADRPSQQQTPQQVWVAVTTTDDSGVYPGPGSNTYPIVFADPSFNENVAGNQTIAIVPNDAVYQNIAANFNVRGSFIPQNTPVFVVEIDRRYYIVQSSSSETIRFELIEPLNLRGNALARAVVWNGAAYVMSGDPFPVFDSRQLAGYFAGYASPGLGLAGFQGVARFGDRNVFEVLTMDRAARFVNFELRDGKDFELEQGGENWVRNILTTYTHDGRVNTPVDLHDRSKLFLGVRGGNFIVEPGSSGTNPIQGVAVFDDEASTFAIEEGAQKNLVYQPIALNLPTFYSFRLQEDMGESEADQASAAILDLHTQAFIRDDTVYDRCGPAGARAFKDLKTNCTGNCYLHQGRFYVSQSPCECTEEQSTGQN